MEKVTISPNYEVVIPPSVRAALDLQPGQEVRVFALEGIIEIVPVRPAHELRGMLRGVEAEFDRDREWA